MSKKQKKRNLNSSEQNKDIKVKKDNLSYIDSIEEEKENIKKELENKVSNQEDKELKSYRYSSTTNNKESEPIKKKSVFINLILVALLIFCLIYFFINIGMNYVDSITEIITLSSIVLFTISFVTIGIASDRYGKLFLLGSLCLGLFFIINLNNSYSNTDIDSIGKVIDLREMNLTNVTNWAEKNNIELIEEYEYSDMVDEYSIISQSIKAGTKLKDVKEITISISGGPNPYKEILIPNMATWNSERVLNFVKNNYLSNVEVEFIESEEKEDTVIEQTGIGNLKRNDEIKLTFSSGEELGYEEVKLKDLTNLSKFEAIFYLKQHHLNYKLEEDFDKNIKASYVKSQDISPGEMVKIDSDIKITLSKGPQIKVPDITKMSTTELTNWIIKNKLKVKFSDKYDENISKNKIIEANVKKGDIIAQGHVVEVVLSKGQLKMKSFKSLKAFKEWADKYGIKYEEEYEFSDSVKAGDVISYSYKKGEVIKNDDVIIVKISDGEKIEVPNLVGLSKKEIESKLKKLGLNYNYVYKNSNTVGEGKAISQSISKGSAVSSGTTITITISKGKESSSDTKNREQQENHDYDENKEDENVPSTPSCDTSKGSEINIQAGDNGNQTKRMLQQLNPNHKFSFTMVSACSNGDSAPGTICNMAGLDGQWKNYCDTIYVTIVQ